MMFDDGPGKASAAPVHCQFHVRYPVPGGWRFRSVHLAGWSGGPWETMWPPSVGDLVSLHDDDGAAPLEGGPVFRVTGRMWSHPAYGSPAWPRAMRFPSSGPTLDVIVEPEDGLFAGEEAGSGEPE